MLYFTKIFEKESNVHLNETIFFSEKLLKSLKIVFLRSLFKMIVVFLRDFFKMQLENCILVFQKLGYS